MPSDGITITGLTELKAKLAALSDKQGDACIRKALKAGAAIEQAAIEERAPVKDETGGQLPPGALKADISVRLTKSENGVMSAIVGPGKLTRHVANWVEYGHRLVRGGYSRLLANGKTRGPGTATGTVEAHPFIRTAYEETRDEVSRAIATTLAAEIEAASGKKGTS